MRKGGFPTFKKSRSQDCWYETFKKLVLLPCPQKVEVIFQYSLAPSWTTPLDSRRPQYWFAHLGNALALAITSQVFFITSSAKSYGIPTTYSTHSTQGNGPHTCASGTAIPHFIIIRFWATARRRALAQRDQSGTDQSQRNHLQNRQLGRRQTTMGFHRGLARCHLLVHVTSISQCGSDHCTSPFLPGGLLADICASIPQSTDRGTSPTNPGSTVRMWQTTFNMSSVSLVLLLLLLFLEFPHGADQLGVVSFLLHRCPERLGELRVVGLILH